MKVILHKAHTRGFANYGWLSSNHTFSFASYHAPDRMGFGTLRVINDDIVAPGKGFDTHPHNNMEIVSIPLKGSLKHQDSIGNEHIIKKGEVQVMSAGNGIQHSEYNNSLENDVNFLQIWILPKKDNIPPSYSQKEFPETDRVNKLQLIISPDGRNNSVKINQDAFFSLTKLNSYQKINYSKHLPKNVIYIFVIDGQFKLNGQLLNQRDGLGIEDSTDLELICQKEGELLIMEVPV